MTAADQTAVQSAPNPPEKIGGSGPHDTLWPLLVVAAAVAASFGGWWAISTFLAPDHLSITLFGRTLEVNHFQAKLLGGFVLGFVSVGSVFLAELLCVGWSNSSLKHLLFNRTRSSWSDLGVFAFETLKINHIILIVLTAGIGLASGLWLNQQVEKALGVQIGIGQWPLIAQVPFCYILYTFLDYWAHRVEHAAVFWPVHRFHHAAKDFYVLTASRVHPADLSSVFMLTVPLLFLAPSAEALVLLYMIAGTVRFLIHSRIPSNFGWIGRWVLQSPLDHRMHHILDMSQGQGGHYGLMPLWDRLFGTWRGGGHPALEIGVTDRTYRHGAWVLPDMLRDYGDFLHETYVFIISGGKRRARPESALPSASAIKRAAPARSANDPASAAANETGEFEKNKA